MDGQIGVIAPGAFADIMAVRGRPAAETSSSWATLQFVMKDGKVFKGETH